MALTKSAKLHEQLDHPVIDADGHALEFMPTLCEYIRAAGGPEAGERAARRMSSRRSPWHEMSLEDKKQTRAMRPSFYNWPSENTLDYATASFPALMAERMGEFGIDFMMVYPTAGLLAMHLPEQAVRRAACRGMNEYFAEIYKGFEKQMRPVAVIPMHTPQEAIEELDYATGKLGFKAAVFAGHVRRPIPAAHHVRGAAGYAFWIDCFGVDSEYDYDPVWRRCMELKIVPAFHSSGMGWTARRSISNHVYNHIGHFASAGDALCKSLLLGGVTRRFPELKFAFLEGGISWANALLCSTVEHWEKRNARDIMQFAPERMDLAKFTELFGRYAPPVMKARAGDIRAARDRLGPGLEAPQSLDDFAAMGITSKKDFIDRFVKPFAFGCEADDRLAATAFQPKLNPTGMPLRALFSSDVSHWDMPDMTEVLEEAHELVEKGLMDQPQFRKFVFENASEMYTSMNPDFFKGTVIEAAHANASAQAR